MKIYCYQQKGSAGDKTEMDDRVLIGKNIMASGYHFCDMTKEYVVGIFDGVGGLKGSAYASAMAAKALSEIYLPASKDDITGALRRIHSMLVQDSSTATTATGLVWNDPTSVILFHVGNTRISGLQNGYLVPLTEDQTNYEKMKREGFDEGLIPSSLKCVLTACLGVRDELLSELIVQDYSEDISRFSRILITSDGVHDYVSIDDLEDFLKDSMTFASLERLANRACEAGSEDDISIVVLEP